MERNISDNFVESARAYNNQHRYLNKNLFQLVLDNGEIIQRDWMVYSKSKGSVFCFKCKLFTQQNTQFFDDDGFNDWKNATAAASQRENNTKPGGHKDACTTWTNLKNASARIDHLHISQHEIEVKYWREVLKRVVATVKFLSSRGLAFSGDYIIYYKVEIYIGTKLKRIF